MSERFNDELRNKTGEERKRLQAGITLWSDFLKIAADYDYEHKFSWFDPIENPKTFIVNYLPREIMRGGSLILYGKAGLTETDKQILENAYIGGVISVPPEKRTLATNLFSITPAKVFPDPQHPGTYAFYVSLRGEWGKELLQFYQFEFQEPKPIIASFLKQHYQPSSPY